MRAPWGQQFCGPWWCLAPRSWNEAFLNLRLRWCLAPRSRGQGGWSCHYQTCEEGCAIPLVLPLGYQHLWVFLNCREHWHLNYAQGMLGSAFLTVCLLLPRLWRGFIMLRTRKPSLPLWFCADNVETKLNKLVDSKPPHQHQQQQHYCRGCV